MEKNKSREQDVLAEAFRKKLANHSLPVDESVWEGIQAKMAAGAGRSPVTGPVPVARKLIAWWVPVSAVASLALLISLGWYFLTGTPQPEIAKVAEHPTTAPEAIDHHRPLAAVPATDRLFSAGEHPTEKRRAVLSGTVPETEIAVDNTSLTAVNPVGVSQQPVTAEAAVSATEEQQKTRTEKREKVDVLAPTGDWTELIADPKPRKPLLAAGISSGVTGTNPSVNGMHYDAMYESFVDYSDRPLRAPAALTPADFKSRDYLPPLTVGIKIRIPFDDTWSLETGLQYTYLKTNLSDANWSGYSADLQLQYLGVPVAMSATLTRSSRWELYWQGGVLLEKGLNSLYHEYRDWGNAVFTTTASTGIEGQQWSVFTALGVGYRIDKKLMLYFDPQLSYFFDNQQPLSIRTEMPLMVGVSAGLRFTF